MAENQWGRKTANDQRYGHKHWVDKEALRFSEMKEEHAENAEEEENRVERAKATEELIRSLKPYFSSIIGKAGEGLIECDPKTFNLFCESNPTLPRKLVIIELDEFGPNRIFLGLSHGADRIAFQSEQYPMKDVLLRLVNTAMNAEHSRYHYEMEEDQEQKKWEKKTFGTAPIAQCRPNGDGSDWRGNQIPLIHPNWCSNDNALCHQDSEPCSKDKYVLDDCHQIVVFDAFGTGDLVYDHLDLLCAYPIRQKMVRSQFKKPCSDHFTAALRRLLRMPSKDDMDIDHIVLPSAALMVLISILIIIGMWIRRRLRSVHGGPEIIDSTKKNNQEMAVIVRMLENE